MALVEVVNVTKEYANGEEKITPLSDVSLQIERGDFAALMGASGSGKSTLLNLIAGIDEVTSGQILVGGTDITKLSRGKLADWRAASVGYVFQTHNLIPVLTAYENVEMPLLLLRMSGAERRKRVNIALEAVGLTDRATHYPRQMSGGQEQRAGIARAIVANPKVVVADEPTGDLDPETTNKWTFDPEVVDSWPNTVEWELVGLDYEGSELLRSSRSRRTWGRTSTKA